MQQAWGMTAQHGKGQFRERCYLVLPPLPLGSLSFVNESWRVSESVGYWSVWTERSGWLAQRPQLELVDEINPFPQSVHCRWHLVMVQGSWHRLGPRWKAFESGGCRSRRRAC